jgi:RsiW-degrading membrane proteinase PrsW (M82 family)
MTWRRYLQSRTRNPAFLWRMVIGILLAGVAAGALCDWARQLSARGSARIVSHHEEPERDFPEPSRIVQMADEGNWLGVWLAIPGTIVRTWRHTGMTALAVLTGACWTAFALQAIQIRGRRDGRLWLSLAALVLGVVSIWPTLVVDLWQERRWGLVPSEDLTAGVRYFALGVGLREELAKFCCFLPLLPWCVMRRDELAALLMAGCVGIGFAMEENIGYIAASSGLVTMGRLLTAVPIHMALTGLLGLAAYRACLWPVPCGPQLAAMFVVLALAHGLFDAFQALPALVDYAIVSQLIFVFLIYQFFHELRPKQALRVEPVSLTANFLFCASTVAAATFVYLSATVGFRAAGDMLAMGALGQGVMAYLFLREMPETMVSV